MASEPIPNDPSDDELEALAEDLFGVSLNQDEDIEPFDVGDFDLDDDDEEPVSQAGAETPVEAPSEPAPQTVSAKAPVPEMADDDFGAMLLDDDAPPPPPKVVKKPATAAPSASTAAVKAETRVEKKASDKAPAAVSKDEATDGGREETSTSEEDDYWDALEGFDWDEESEDAKPVPAESKKYVESTETFEDLIESAEKSDEFLDDVDFGAGLDEEAERSVGGQTAATVDEEEKETDKERKGRRRRGGRRRGRRARSQEREDQETAQTESGKGEGTARPAESPEPAEKPRRSTARTVEVGDEEDDGFGAGLEVETSDAETSETQRSEATEIEDEEERPRKRRRRGGRRRGRRKRDDETAAESTTESDAAAEVDDTDEAAGEETGSRADKYRSVPTWEEAISYLVRREPKKSSDGRRSNSGSRRGRRGSSRRRS